MTSLTGLQSTIFYGGSGDDDLILTCGKNYELENKTLIQ